MTILDDLLPRTASGGLSALAVGAAAEAVLSLTPISWPVLPAVLALVAPARVGSSDHPPLSRLRAAAVVFCFVIGMDGVIASAGAVLIALPALLTHRVVVLSVVVAAVLGYAGVRMLTARSSLCNRVGALPPEPLHAVPAGTAFAVTGCPGCISVANGAGGAAAAGGPLTAAGTILAFVVGRAAVLYGAALPSARVLRAGNARSMRILDVTIGVTLIASSLFYLGRVLLGDVPTRLPGETGGGLG